MDRRGLYSLLSDQAPLCDLLIRVLTVSQFLADVLIRNPEYLYWIAENPALYREPVQKPELDRRLRSEVAVFGELNHRLDALRRLRRRELLRIGLGEASGVKDMDVVGMELSNLADLTIEILLAELLAELGSRHGTPTSPLDGREARFAVIGLGKLGGQELNFSSDIDVLFVYSEEGDVLSRNADPGTRKAMSNYEFFNRLAERIVHEATRGTGEGFIHRVDARLRPEGRSGPLARSLSSYSYYYEGRGETWERQMLIKARCCAGDSSLGQAFLTAVEPFVYPAVLTENPSEEIRKIKIRIEARIGDRDETYSNLKLRPGGIRDIEFVVQALQLLAGRRFPALRERNTVRAIEALTRHGTLSPEEGSTLLDSYRLLRRIEHYLQMMEARATYQVPSNPDEMNRLAVRLGYKGGAELIEFLNSTFSAVRRIYDEVFRSSGSEGDASIQMIHVMEMGDSRAVALLEKWGFADPLAAHRHLLGIAGRGKTTIRDPSVEESLQSVILPMLRRLSASPDPDLALSQFGRVIDSYGAADVLYDLFADNESVLDLLIDLCGTSRFLGELVVRDPSLLDWLVAPGTIEAARDQEAMDSALREAIASGHDAPIHYFRSRELLRIGCRDIVRLASPRETFGELSTLADTVVRCVYADCEDEASREFGRPGRPEREDSGFICVAVGKLGGGELNFGSDLDLLFVYEGDEDDPEAAGGGRPADKLSFHSELSARMLARLTSVTQAGVLYHVDARLRPEGGNGPLAMSLAHYAAYMERRASTWERLVYLRARLIAGDSVLADRFLKRIDAFVFGSPVRKAFFREVSDMRKRIETVSQQRHRGAIDLKSAPGGTVDVEFLISALQIRHGIRQTNLLTAISLLQDAGMLGSSEGATLTENYVYLRTVEKALRIGDERASSVLPREPARQLRLARHLGYADPMLFASDVKRRMARIRDVYDQAMQEDCGWG